MKNKRKNVKWVSIVSAVLLLIYIIFDIINLPSKMGIHIDNINIDLLGIVIGNLVIIAGAVVTYFLIDARNIEKDNMAKCAALYLLKESYDAIEAFIPIIETCIKGAKENGDTKEPLFNEKTQEYISNSPFENNKMIYESLSNGNIDYQLYKAYTEIKKKYEVSVTTLNLGNIDLSNNVFVSMKEQISAEIKSIENKMKAFEK